MYNPNGSTSRKYIPSRPTLNYPNKYSLVTCATKRTRVWARNQVTKNITSVHLQRTFGFENWRMDRPPTQYQYPSVSSSLNTSASIKYLSRISSAIVEADTVPWSPHISTDPEHQRIKEVIPPTTTSFKRTRKNSDWWVQYVTLLG